MSSELVYITKGPGNSLKVNSTHRENMRRILMEKPGEQLLYYEMFDNQEEAAYRKTAIQQWPYRKIELVIGLFNPGWNDCRSEII